MANVELVKTTCLALAFFAACRTCKVPLTAGEIISFGFFGFASMYGEATCIMKPQPGAASFQPWSEFRSSSTRDRLAVSTEAAASVSRTSWALA